MSESNDIANVNDPRDELEDRLADLALAETIGNQRPPDLSKPIRLAADKSHRAWSGRGKLALAASLLLLATAGGMSLAAYRAYRNEQAISVGSMQPTLQGRYVTTLGSGAERASETKYLDEMREKLDRTAGDATFGTGEGRGRGANQPLDELRVGDQQPDERFRQLESEIKTRPAPASESTPAVYPDKQYWNNEKRTGAQAVSTSHDRKPVGGPSQSATAADQGAGKPADPYSVARPEVETKTKDPGYSVSKPTYADALDSADRSGGGKSGGGQTEKSKEGLTTNLNVVADEQFFSPAKAEAGLAVNNPVPAIREFESKLEHDPAQPGYDKGRGPGQAGDRYSRVVENPFLKATDNPLSTFSIDVDTASYAKTRRYLLQNNQLPPPDAVRIEEFVNYFHYDYPAPVDEKPFAAHVEAAACPWEPKHRLVRVGLKGREIARENRPASNLVFLLDVSGSMEPQDKLPRVRRSMRMLVDQLGENDRVAIAVYAGASGLALPSTPGYRKDEIVRALESLHSGGSTNGGSGIRLAYDVATQHFIKGGTNRVVLCTDGDFNVGTTSTAELERLIEEKAKSGVFLTVLGFGMGNHNDDMLEKLADKGNGNYGYIDTEEEARKLLVDELSGTLITIAKDVKIQIEFNPRTVGAYRLVGYENRMLRAEDFNDDKKDAGEIGAGHTVTALYEIVPPGEKLAAPPVDALRYQQVAQPADATASSELLTLKLRYKEPDGQESKAPLLFPVTDRGLQFGQASKDFKFASAVAGFAMLLRDSAHRGNFTYDAVLEIAQEGRGEDRNGYRSAFFDLVKRAKVLSGK